MRLRPSLLSGCRWREANRTSIVGTVPKRPVTNTRRDIRLETSDWLANAGAMKNIALHLDDETHSKAERKAGVLQTSISEVAADYLRHWAAEEVAVEQARRNLANRFAQPNWQFAVGTPDDRTLRNARC